MAARGSLSMGALSEKIDVTPKKSTGNTTDKSTMYNLSSSWVLWAHMPHETDWSLKSYKKISDIKNVEQAIAIKQLLPESMIKNSMLFLMKEGINPMWEDEANRDGGCFSYKIHNKDVHSTWCSVFYSVLGKTLTKFDDMNSCINGITISPKKNFCIIKVWLSNCKYQDPTLIRKLESLTPTGCLFKKHKPEF